MGNPYTNVAVKGAQQADVVAVWEELVNKGGTPEGMDRKAFRRTLVG